MDSQRHTQGHTWKHMCTETHIETLGEKHTDTHRDRETHRDIHTLTGTHRDTQGHI